MNRHAALIEQYAEIWKTNPTPWKRVQCRSAALSSPDCWTYCTQHPGWADHVDYRIVPTEQPIVIGGIAFERPMDGIPADGTRCFIPCPSNPTGYDSFVWDGDAGDYGLLKAGWCFSTPEAAASMNLAISMLMDNEHRVIDNADDGELYNMQEVVRYV